MFRVGENGKDTISFDITTVIANDIEAALVGITYDDMIGHTGTIDSVHVTQTGDLTSPSGITWLITF